MTPTRRKQSQQRRGGALLELVICLPILAGIIFGTIETCTMIFLQQSLEITAYEGVRTAIVPSATKENVEAVCNQILQDRRIQGGAFTITPANPETATEGTYIVVEVSAPCAQNSFSGTWFFGGRTLTGRVEMMCELDPPGS